VVLGQREDGQAFGHVLFQPFGQIRGGLPVGHYQLGQGGFGFGQRGRVSDCAHLSADALAGRQIGRMMDGVPGQMELTTLPIRTTKDGPAGGAQTGMVVGNDVFHPAHATRLQALQEGPPVNFRL
jgi:hypothetical protein